MNSVNFYKWVVQFKMTEKMLTIYAVQDDQLRFQLQLWNLTLVFKETGELWYKRSLIIIMQAILTIKENIKNDTLYRENESIFLQINGHQQTVKSTLQTVDKLGWDMVSHPPCSPDLGPNRLLFV